MNNKYYETKYAKGLNIILPELLVSHIIYKFDPTFHFYVHQKVIKEIPNKVLLWNYSKLSENEMVCLYYAKKYSNF